MKNLFKTILLLSIICLLLTSAVAPGGGGGGRGGGGGGRGGRGGGGGGEWRPIPIPRGGHPVIRSSASSSLGYWSCIATSYFAYFLFF
ncbi:hypothetical protein RND71_011014 [Anisodus tanguticus]|uniref:Uncharacterized protein n=1 Tax=Anisodus tanguticus TaxID=243964 RepID=A0AAE1SKV0_9SOLA|nr:hypothetical protein RND71_011014 [Anisodus tanguticus]